MDNLRFGISYNIFDGCELLEDSINQIRKSVDYISVVYQRVSYWGNDVDEKQLEIINDLLNRGLVDELCEYVPILNSNLSPSIMEEEKRNIGLKLSLSNNCTHHMSLDCDEFFLKSQFNKYISWCNENPTKLAYSHFIDYVKLPQLQLTGELSKTHITLFIPINKDTVYNRLFDSHYLVNPTRRVETDKYELLDSELITMHHMTLVRKDLSMKLLNASKREIMTDEKINSIINFVEGIDQTKPETYSKSDYGVTRIKQRVFLKNFNNF